MASHTSVFDIGLDLVAAVWIDGPLSEVATIYVESKQLESYGKPGNVVCLVHLLPMFSMKMDRDSPSQLQYQCKNAVKLSFHSFATKPVTKILAITVLYINVMKVDSDNLAALV